MVNKKNNLLIRKLLILSVSVCFELLNCAQPKRVISNPEDRTTLTIRLKDCRFMGWKKTIGIGLEIFTDKIKKASLELGIALEEVREMDDLLKDYAAKYETSCRDYVMGSINMAEYNCRRGNMDKALDNIRLLKVLLEKPQPQEVVREAIKTFLELAREGYKKGCGPGMEAEPRKIIFARNWPERFFEIINRGNREFTYAILNLPEAFKPTPRSGKLLAGDRTTIGIARQYLPAEAGENIPFLVKNNYDEEVQVEIYVSSENAKLFEKWGAEVSSLAKAENRLPNFEDSLAVVNKYAPTLTIESTRYMLAGNMLLEADNFKESGLAFQKAVEMDSTISNDPASQLVFGVLEYKKNHPEVALGHFKEAAILTWPEDPQTGATAELFSGSLLSSQGHKEAAAEHFRVTGVYEKAKKDDGLRRFVEKLFGFRDLLSLITDVTKDKKKFL